MVIVCQKCQTRFQLDESRIPAKGARVRCSRCKHAFVVAPPGGHDETVHRLAAEAAASGRPAVPEPTVDLHGATRRPGRAPSDEPEDDWQFNIEPPAPAAPARPAPARPRAVEPAAASREAPVAPRDDEEEVSPSGEATPDSIENLFELGGLRDADPAVLEGEITDSDPTPFEAEDAGAVEAQAPTAKASPAAPAGGFSGWDFSLDDGPAPERAPSTRAPSPPPAKAAKPTAERRKGRKRAAAPVAAPQGDARRAADAAPEQRPRERAGETALAARLLEAVAWLPAAALFAFGVLGALAPAPVQRELPTEQVGPLELRGLRARHLENYWSGPLLVLQGELENPGATAASLGGAPQVRITGTPGAALAPAWLGAALHESVLRERDPRELAAALEHSAQQLAARPLRPGESLPVQAVFEAPPLAADGLRVELAPVARPPAEPPSELPPESPAPEPDAAPEVP